VAVARDVGLGLALGGGLLLSRLGRRFFDDAALERELLATVQSALNRSGFWDQFRTNWVCLDCELMPWSAKALELVRQQYASVGTAARVGLGEAVDALQQAAARGVDVGPPLERHRIRRNLAQCFAQAYRHYCWPVESLRDIRVAPFHVMATEGAVHTDKDHVWHMTTISSLVDPDGGLLMATPYHVVDLADGHLAALRYGHGRPGAHVFNLGTGHGILYKPLDEWKKLLD